MASSAADQSRPLRRLLASVGHVLMAPSYITSEPDFFALHREAREVLGTSCLARADPASAAAAWHRLALMQEGRRDYGAARRSLRRALSKRHHRQLSPHVRSDTHLLLALLSMGGRGGGCAAAATAEHHLLASEAADASNPLAAWHLGQVRIHRGDVAAGEAKLREALALLVAQGWREYAILCGRRRETELARRQREAEERAESAAFVEWCEAQSALRATPDLASNVVAAVAELKRCARDAEWLVEWGVESTLAFGPSGPQWNAAAYGETPFQSWQRVVASPAVAEALQMGRRGGGERPYVVIAGAALGYIALWFRALGCDCLGVDVLEKTMVGTANSVLGKHDLHGCGIRFEAGDALKLSREALARPPSLLWLNDEAWRPSARRRMLRRAASVLCAGGVVISYGTAPFRATRRLRQLEALCVPTSWHEHEQIRILARV
jgi:hypothetical protein